MHVSLTAVRPCLAHPRPRLALDLRFCTQVSFVGTRSVLTATMVETCARMQHTSVAAYFPWYARSQVSRRRRALHSSHTCTCSRTATPSAVRSRLGWVSLLRSRCIAGTAAEEPPDEAVERWQSKHVTA